MSSSHKHSHDPKDLSPQLLEFLERLRPSQEIDELKLLIKDIKSKKVVISTDIKKCKEKLERLVGMLFYNYPVLMNSQNKNLIDHFTKTLDDSVKSTRTSKPSKRDRLRY